MEIKIKPNVLERAVRTERYRYSPNANYFHKLAKFEGRWMKVDTEYLFDNQYNTVEGLRVMDEDVSEIMDDIRPIQNNCVENNIETGELKYEQQSTNN